MKARTQYISQSIRHCVNTIDAKADVILYGSRAREEERPDSDWDILVLTDYPVDVKTEKVFRDIFYDLELETGEPFSIFIYSKHDWSSRQKITPFYHNVVKEGIRL